MRDSRSYTHKKSGKHCMGDHSDGQCIYCEKCHGFIRPENISDLCHEFTHSKTKKELYCKRCNEGKFNVKLANLSLWKKPEPGLTEQISDKLV